MIGRIVLKLQKRYQTLTSQLAFFLTKMRVLFILRHVDLVHSVSEPQFILIDY